MTTLAAPLRALTAEDSGLGLIADQVTVVDHDPRWAALYDDVAWHVTDALDGFDAVVEHIGSTSVPGLAAKPVLDIAVGAKPPVDDQAYIYALEQSGFTFQADLGVYGGLLFSVNAEPDVTVANLHVVDIDDFQWRWYLAFRDGLRSDPELRSTYAALKQESAAANATSRDGYNKAKFEWVLDAVSRLDGAPD